MKWQLIFLVCVLSISCRSQQAEVEYELLTQTNKYRVLFSESFVLDDFDTNFFKGYLNVESVIDNKNLKVESFEIQILRMFDEDQDTLLNYMSWKNEGEFSRSDLAFIEQRLGDYLNNLKIEIINQDQPDLNRLRFFIPIFSNESLPK